MLYRVCHKSLIRSVLLYVVVIVIMICVHWATQLIDQVNVTMTTIDQCKTAIRSVVIVLQLNVVVIVRMTTGHYNNDHNIYNTYHRPSHCYDDHGHCNNDLVLWLFLQWHRLAVIVLQLNIVFIVRMTTDHCNNDHNI